MQTANGATTLWHRFFPSAGMNSRQQTAAAPRELQHIRSLARAMDSQFRIPGTDFRFGLDGIIGLIPGVGDLTTFAVSGYIMWLMARNGASSYVLVRMGMNVLVDAAIGSIPFIGDIFDFAFKANTRNLRLMEQYYEEGRHRGSAWRIVVPILVLLLLIIALIFWGIWSLLTALF
jgi:hypothetical protein